MPLPHSYTWLLFDADGTLFDYERAEAAALQNTFAQYDVPFAPDALALYGQINAQMWQAFEQRQITQAALAIRRFELLFETLGRPTPPQFSTAYLDHLGRCAILMEGAEAMLQALHPHYQIAILTNGIKAVQQSRLARSTIRDYISALIISEAVGAAKPDPAYFDAAFEQLGRPSKAAALMIGDSLTSDMRGASRYGLDTCWYNPRREPPPEDLALTYEIARLGELTPLLTRGYSA
jgi:2-haloacid dehalogenase